MLFNAQEFMGFKPKPIQKALGTVSAPEFMGSNPSITTTPLKRTETPLASDITEEMPYRPGQRPPLAEKIEKVIPGGALQMLNVPFRGFEAIKEKQMGQFTGKSESETKKAMAQALMPEVFGTDKRTHADYIDVMERAGIEPNEMYIPYILANIAEFVSAPAMMTGGKAFGAGGQKALTVFEKIEQLKKAFGISDIEAGQWLRAAKIPEKAKVTLAQKLKSAMQGAAEGYAEGLGMGAKAEPIAETMAKKKTPTPPATKQPPPETGQVLGKPKGEVKPNVQATEQPTPPKPPELGKLSSKPPVSQTVKPVATGKPAEVVKKAEPPKEPPKPPTAVAGGAEELPKPKGKLKQLPEKKPEGVGATEDYDAYQKSVQSYIDDFENQYAPKVKTPTTNEINAQMRQAAKGGETITPEEAVNRLYMEKPQRALKEAEAFRKPTKFKGFSPAELKRQRIVR